MALCLRHAQQSTKEERKRRGESKEKERASFRSRFFIITLKRRKSADILNFLIFSPRHRCFALLFAGFYQPRAPSNRARNIIFPEVVKKALRAQGLWLVAQRAAGDINHQCQPTEKPVYLPGHGVAVY
jgi:hypothetical protein